MVLTKLVDKGTSEYIKGKFKSAIVYYKKGLDITNNKLLRATIHYNIGLSYYSLREYADAQFHFQRSVDFGRSASNWELCLCKLHLNDITGLELFDYRPDKSSNVHVQMPIPEIKSKDELKDCKKLLVLNEQGFGDELLFSRGLELLKNIEFNYQVYPENLDLFKTFFNGNFFTERVVGYDFILDYDKWILTGDLFKYYTQEKGIYPIFPEIDYPIEKNGTGFCFQTNQLSPNAKLRSVSIDTMRNKVLLNKKNLISLQKDIKLDFAHCPTLSTFLDTFNIIKGLEEVITIDTAVAHLAAICKVKTYLLYTDYIDWRWKINFYGNHVIPVKVQNFEYL